MILTMINKKNTISHGFPPWPSKFVYEGKKLKAFLPQKGPRKLLTQVSFQICKGGSSDLQH